MTILNADQLDILGEKDTVVVVDPNGNMLVESDAAIFILSKLNSPMRFLGWLSIIPKIIRDLVYRFVANNRYRVFGRKESCEWSPKYQSRMLAKGTI